MRSAIIFAGGRATRLGGVNKALLKVGGRPIIAQLLDVLRPRAEDLLAVVNDDALADIPELRLVRDPESHAGVLPALRTALDIARGDVCLAVAADMPFASGALFDTLLALADDLDVVIPVVGGQPEPMHAVYRRGPCLKAIEAALTRGEKRMIAFHRDVRVRLVDESIIRLHDPNLMAFFNVNTAEDLARAERIAVRASAESSTCD